MTVYPLLTLLVFLPAAGGVLTLFYHREARQAAQATAAVVAGTTLLLAGWLIAVFPAGVAGMYFEERLPWVPGLGIEYHVGVDGINVLLVGLTALLGFVTVIAPWPSVNGRAREYAGYLLLLQAGVTGALVALDLVLFFVFWEFMLIPMYFLVGTCGGPRRIEAALKFFIYTSLGSLLMLIAIIALYLFNGQQTGTYTFNVLALADAKVPADAQLWLFLAFALAFAIKVPIVPFHTWLPDVYTQSPVTALVLGTMLVKVGSYGFIRFGLTLFPEASHQLAPVIAALAVVGILYGGLAAIGQRDLVGVLAYSSIAQLGFVILGIFALNRQSIQGALFQMVNHGLSAGALFLIAALILARTQTTSLDRLGGLAQSQPVLAGFFLISMLSAVGLPGLNSFVGEFLILMGAYQTLPALAVLATLGVVLTAIYLLTLYRKTMHGEAASPDRAALTLTLSQRERRLDLTPRESIALVPLVVLFVWLGLFPAPFLSKMDASVAAVVQRTQIAQPMRASSEVGDYRSPSQPPTPDPYPPKEGGLVWRLPR
ncbi:MAG: NADH-quinone oxidoreductase subunit M [Chloroflexi bacterium]|nr:NADH-quinone oxidoreductase subunit M [Chloroflexota bacterium]